MRCVFYLEFDFKIVEKKLITSEVVDGSSSRLNSVCCKTQKILILNYKL